MLLTTAISGCATVHTGSSTTRRLQREAHYQNYAAFIYEGTNADGSVGSFEVFKDGKRVYNFVCEGAKFGVGTKDSAATNQYRLEMGDSVTEPRKHNLVIFGELQDAHACVFYQVFELGKHFRKVADLVSGQLKPASDGQFKTGHLK